MAPADGVALQVEVAYSPAARTVDVVALSLPAGSTVGDAVATSGLLARHGLSVDGTPAAVSMAVWGRAVSAATLLRDRDRVELLRPLLVDPKEARRLRYRSQGERRVKARR